MSEVPTSDPCVTIAMGDDGVTQVHLNRPDKHNAIDSAMFAALIAAGEQLAFTPGLRCVVLSGAGNSFCAGLDTAMFPALLSADAPPLADRTHDNANTFQQAAMAWRNLPVPVIAAVQGICFGGGLQLAAGADIRIVAPEARLAVMEMKWGIIPDMCHYALWRGLVRDDVLRELTYTAREFSGEEALTLGFATHVDTDPLARAHALAREIAGKHPQAIRTAKHLFNRAPDMALDDILLAESRAQDLLIGSPNQIEAVLSGMAGRPASFVDP
jgi:enoyl-CoA hydratase/carnithine racemase